MSSWRSETTRIAGRTALFAAAILVLTAPQRAAAAQGGGRPDRADRFAARDADGDGRLSFAEFADLDRQLQRWDRNGDGTVTPADVPDGRFGDRLLRVLERLDRDQDGVVTRGELEGGRRSEFTRLDGDGDGFVTRAEAETARAGGPEGAGEWRRPDGAGRLAHLDADGDGSISLAEFTARDRLFDRLDADGDGVVRRGDLPEGPRAEAMLRRFDRLDSDHDGVLTRAEAARARREAFERLDGDGDGVLSHAEVRPRGAGRGPG